MEGIQYGDVKFDHGPKVKVKLNINCQSLNNYIYSLSRLDYYFITFMQHINW